MDFKRPLILAAALCSLTLNVYAATDPIGWSQTGNLPARTNLNNSYAIHFTLVSHLPFTMPTPLKISNNSSPSSEVTMVDGCSGLRLTPGQSCSVGLVLVPKTPGVKHLSVFIEYGRNKVLIPQTAATTTTNPEGTSDLQAILLQGFPSAILTGQPYSLSFEFKNNGTTTLSGLTLRQDPNNSAVYTQGSATNCTSIDPGESCVVNGSFTTSATSGAVFVGYTLSSSSISSSLSTASVINNSSGQGTRTLTFVNNCNFDVWFGTVSGNVSNQGCKSDSQCPYPSLCNKTANGDAGLCFYPAPAPVDGSYQLSAAGGTKVVVVTDYGSQFQYVWSGNIAGRTGCTGPTCETADCGNGGGACPTGSGFQQPATLAEFTLQRSTVDSYDISILNGINAGLHNSAPEAVGIQITPTSIYPFANAFTPPEYNCGSPGNKNSVNGLGGCPWTFDPDSDTKPIGQGYRFKYVTPNTSNPGCLSSCNSGEECGLYYDSNAQTLDTYCGKVIGYNTANQVCSFHNTNITPPTTPNNPGDPYFQCDSASGVSIYTFWALFSCQAQANGDLNTCFNTSQDNPPSTTNCCGCVNWATAGIPGITVPSNTVQCVNSNSAVWANDALSNGVLPNIKFIKRGCSTAYAWPFDDKSSSFACSDISSSHTSNAVNYTITFCPQN